MDTTYEYARLAQRLRWAFEAISDVASTLLEMQRGDLSAQAFNLEVQCAKLHERLVEALKNTPPLPRRQDASTRFDHEIPF